LVAGDISDSDEVPGQHVRIDHLYQKLSSPHDFTSKILEIAIALQVMPMMTWQMNF